jgi:hypothetical protein
VGWTKRSFDFRRERRRWSRLDVTGLSGQDRETELKFREMLHAPWWHLPTLLSHSQLPCSSPVSSSARSIFEKQDGAFSRSKHHTLAGQPGGNM